MVLPKSLKLPWDQSQIPIHVSLVHALSDFPSLPQNQASDPRSQWTWSLSEGVEWFPWHVGICAFGGFQKHESSYGSGGPRD